MRSWSTTVQVRPLRGASSRCWRPVPPVSWSSTTPCPRARPSVELGAGAGAGAGGTGVVEVIEVGVNLGYGSGANRGAAGCSAEFLLVCNPDVVVEVSALDRLVEALEADRALAVVGPKVLEPDGTRYPSARRFPSLLESAGHALAGLVAPDNRFTRRYRMSDLDTTEQTTRVDWVSGSFMFWRRAAFEELGGFDEAYFMYGEDVDICWRAHRGGLGSRLRAGSHRHARGGHDDPKPPVPDAPGPSPFGTAVRIEVPVGASPCARPGDRCGPLGQTHGGGRPPGVCACRGPWFRSGAL